MQYSFLNALKSSTSLIGILIDPEKTFSNESISLIVKQIHESGIHCILVGGSSLNHIQTSEVISKLKLHTSLPILLFPGDASQFSENADALLLLNLISGRNPTYLIDQHIRAARKIVASKIEVISTSYLLLDGGVSTSVAQLTETKPMNLSNEDAIIDTCLAGHLIGHQCLYLETGSGAKTSVPVELIKKIRHYLDVPIIVGGGITTRSQLMEFQQVGVNLIVIGTKIETDPQFFQEIKSFISECSSKTNPNL